MASLQRIRRMIAIAIRLGYLFLLMFLLIVPAKLQASNNDLHLNKELKITGCPPPPPNYFPYSDNTYCKNNITDAGVYGVYTKLLTLDSILLGFKYNFTPGCPAPPPSYYPYTAPPYCQNAITDAGIYGEWWLLASIDSNLGGGGGGGFIKGTVTPNHIPYASSVGILSDGPLVVSGSNVDVPAFLFGPTGYYFTLNGAAAMGFGNCQLTLNPTAGSAFFGATLNNYVSFSKTNGLFVPDSIAEEFSTDSFDIKIPTATSANVGNVLTLVNSKGGVKWASPSASGFWSLTGNTGLSSATNFLGTTDSATLIFRVNNHIAGVIDSVDNNTFLGYLAGGEIHADYNTAIGYEAMQSNRTGIVNVAIGRMALQGNTSGLNNIAIGNAAEQSNTTGSGNVAIGGGALETNNGSENVAIGDNADHGDITSFDVGIGSGVVVQGNYSTALGYNAMNDFANSIALGANSAVTASNQCMIGGTNTFAVRVLSDSSFGSNMLGDSVLGSVSGYAIFYEVWAGKSITEIDVYIGNLTGTASYTFNVPMLHQPSVFASNDVAAGVVTSRSNTAVTITGTGTTGNLTLKGH